MTCLRLMAARSAIACNTLPGTPERERVLEDALKKVRDQELARKFAALALSGLDQQLHRTLAASVILHSDFWSLTSEFSEIRHPPSTVLTGSTTANSLLDTPQAGKTGTLALLRRQLHHLAARPTCDDQVRRHEPADRV